MLSSDSSPKSRTLSNNKNNQLDAQFFFRMYLFIYLFIPILYMFRATLCSSSGESMMMMSTGMLEKSGELKY